MKKSLLLLILLSLVSCHSKPKEIPESNLPKDFQSFYDKFLTDSSFQMDHILFPLQGLPDYADPETDDLTNFRWKKDAWTIHKKFNVEKSNFYRKFVLVSDGLIIEYIVSKDNRLCLERRFSKSGSEWDLIYYAGLNPVRK